MVYKTIVPSDILKPYIKRFWFFDSEEFITREEVLLPSGYLQIAFNLGGAEWQSKYDDNFETDTNLELRGQQMGPSRTKMIGRDIILGINFHSHTACCFINDKAALFSNSIFDLCDVFGKNTTLLYEMLLSENDLTTQINILETFLIKRLSKYKVKERNIEFLNYTVASLAQDITTPNAVKKMTTETGYSERHIQRLFKEYIGITPKELQKIYRFHESLRELNKSPNALTPIAYNCGYSDQSHFIKDFKSFTGITPSSYQNGLFPSSSSFL